MTLHPPHFSLVKCFACIYQVINENEKLFVFARQAVTRLDTKPFKTNCFNFKLTILYKSNCSWVTNYAPHSSARALPQVVKEAYSAAGPPQWVGDTTPGMDPSQLVKFFSSP